MSKPYEHTSGMTPTNLDFAVWSRALGDAKLTTALMERTTRHCHILEIRNQTHRVLHSSAAAKKRIEAREESATCCALRLVPGMSIDESGRSTKP